MVATHGAMPWYLGKIVRYKLGRDRSVILKEVMILIYLDSPIPELSAPVDEVSFMRTAYPSPLRGRWRPAIIPLHLISKASTEETLTPYFNLGVDFKR